MTNIRPLTPRQQAAVDAIRESLADRGYPPSVRELGAAIGLSSTSSVKHVLNRLRDKGAIVRQPGRPRAIAITGGVCPACGRPEEDGTTSEETQQ